METRQPCTTHQVLRKFGQQINIESLQVVAPKRIALGEANKKLEGATKKLVGIRARVKELQDKVAALEDNLMRV